MTHLCINCNSPRVERRGEEFTCAKCGFTWNVAHEQANAAYLASQGRTPAQSMAEIAALEADSGLDAALGLTGPTQPPDTGIRALDEVPGKAVDQPARADALAGPVSTTDEDGMTRVILREPHPLTPVEYDQAERVLTSKTVAEIEDIADRAGIDLADAKLKVDKIAALLESGRVVLADDGATVIVISDDSDEDED